MTPFELVNDMGIGINFGNTFECYDTSISIKSPYDQITLWGNSPLTKTIIYNLTLNN